MTDEQKIIVIGAIRAALRFEQKQVAFGAGISERTFIEAEKGRRCSPNTWKAISHFYASNGWFATTLNGRLHIYRDVH